LRLREPISERITVIKFGKNNAGSSSTYSWRIDIRSDTANLTNVIVAGFGKRFNLVMSRVLHR